MSQKVLRIFRIVVSLIFVISISLIFIDFRGITPSNISNTILYLQFVPSLIKFLNVLSFAVIGFIVIIIINILFGRVYCSTVCPLGIFQDIVSYIAKKIRRKKKYKYTKARNFFRYSFLAIPIIVWLFGSIFVWCISCCSSGFV